MSDKPQEIRYTPAGTGSTLSAIIRSLLDNFIASNNLGYRLATRNIRARYRQSFLGIFWLFLPPIATSFIWIFLNKTRVVTFADTGSNYAVFVIIGTTMWQVFAGSLLAPIQGVNSAKSILTKINFPREAILFSSFYEVVLNSLVGLGIVTITLVISGTFSFTTYLHLLPAFLTLIVIGIMCGLFLLPFTLLFQDIQFALPMLLTFAMYLTPVVYPRPVFSGVDWLFNYNPVGIIIQTARKAVLAESFSVPWNVLVISGGSILLLIAGVVIFKILMEIVIERMGS